MTNPAAPAMPYRRLGRSGLQVSILSFGSWVTFANQLHDDNGAACMQAAWDAGVNFFDNAEVYAGGQSEALMGRIIRELGWPRERYVISTKFFWGLADGPNQRNTLNRKYLRHAIEGSLERAGLEFYDLVFCHRADPNTPIVETVWAMHDMIERGQALYWGTSMWPADDIRAAYEIAERHHLHAPVMEQPQYHLLDRRRVEVDYARLYREIGLGLTTWSPLASGLLSGKYAQGVPEGSRATLAGYGWLARRITDADLNERVLRLRPIADELDCTLSQLAIAWCAANPDVSTVITGASRPEQVVENMGALGALARMTPEVKARIEEVLGSTPTTAQG
jgi:voltage-dependent potassium channel beta subunit